MSLPNYEALMKPLLESVKDGKESDINKSIDYITKKLKLTTKEVNTLLPSGSETILKNRIRWAKTYLVQSGLLVIPKRGIFVITKEGKEILRKNIEINSKTLPKTEKYKKFLGIKNSESKEEAKQNNISPDEMLENSFDFLMKELENELLEKVKQSSPQFFEKLVVDLLLAMGYGGSRIEAGKVLQMSHDGGIDGFIKEDRLGLDIIYIQAKRWNKNSIGRPEIQQFIGALQEKHSKRGVFITTSKFSKQAFEYVRNIENKVVLIDGEELTRLMREFNVGVEVKEIYEVKEINSDYFEE